MPKKKTSQTSITGVATNRDNVRGSYVPTSENTIANPKPPKGGTGTTKKK